MTSTELIDKLDIAIRDFEKATAKVELANAAQTEASNKLKDLIGSSSKNMVEIKDTAHRKIGELMLAERRSN